MVVVVVAVDQVGRGMVRQVSSVSRYTKVEKGGSSSQIQWVRG